uniref:Uncharacterized protein n=1 Tax=Arundo donax TaxID=35708 RepID=A0A0A8ZVR6_ARUDO
MVLFATMYMIK